MANRKTEQKKVYQMWALLTTRFSENEEFNVADMDALFVEARMMDAHLLDAVHGDPDWGARLLQRNEGVKALNRAGATWSPPFQLVTASGAGPIAGGGTRKYINAEAYGHSLAVRKAKAPVVMYKGVETALRKCRAEMGDHLSVAAQTSLTNIEREAKREGEVAAFKADRMQAEIDEIMATARRENVLAAE